MFASRILGCSLSLVLVALTSTARELHVIGVFAPGARLNACLSLRWESDVLFYNSGSTTEQVRLLNVSNGEIAVGRTTTMEVPPGRVVSLRRTTGQFWFPRDPPTSVSLWMWRLEVPETVEVTSFMELRTIFCPFPENKPDRGQITLPTFDRLVPAGQEQLFLGTDLGSRERRVNVGIYNAGPATATAEVTVRRNCDGSILATDVVSIPPDTIVQRTALHVGAVTLFACAEDPTGGTHTTVSVDQPSIAFVSALAMEEATTLTHNFVAE